MRSAATTRTTSPTEKFDALDLDLHDRPPRARPRRRGRARPSTSTASYFHTSARSWTSPGAWFGLQHILRNRVPRDTEGPGRRALGAPHVIFPGGLNPRIEEIVAGGQPLLGDRGDALAARWTTARPPASGASACAITRRDPQPSGATRFSTTTTGTSSTCVNAFDKHYSRSRNTRFDGLIENGTDHEDRAGSHRAVQARRHRGRQARVPGRHRSNRSSAISGSTRSR